MNHSDGVPSVEQLEVLKSRSIAQLAMRCGRLINELGFAMAREANPDIRAGHLALMPHLEHTGSRVTEIAERAGISKQAVSVHVAELIDMRILEAVADPLDGRAKLIRFTKQGRAEIARGLGLLANIDARIREELGQRRSDALRRSLADVDAMLSAASDGTVADG